jgi:hypothetical protein
MRLSTFCGLRRDQEQLLISNKIHQLLPGTLQMRLHSGLHLYKPGNHCISTYYVDYKGFGWKDNTWNTVVIEITSSFYLSLPRTQKAPDQKQNKQSIVNYNQLSYVAKCTKHEDTKKTQVETYRHCLTATGQQWLFCNTWQGQDNSHYFATLDRDSRQFPRTGLNKTTAYWSKATREQNQTCG